MKKVLLCLLAVTIGFAGYSQKKAVYQPNVPSAVALSPERLGWEPVKTKPITSSSVVPPANYQGNRGVDFVNIVSIGTSANAYGYGYGGGQKSLVYANNDLNVVTNFHRMGGSLDPGGYSGDLGYDVSFDGGMTWTNMVECYVSNISGGTYNIDAGRYPNHGIYNPPGNTDPNSAYLTYFAPILDGSNAGDSWGGYAYGRANFGDITDTTENLSHSAAPYYQYIPDAYDVANATGIAIAVDPNQDWGSGSLVYQGSLIVTRGVWDDGAEDFVFERSLIDFPTNAENDRPTHVKFGWAPDGMTGWIVVITDNGMVTPLDPTLRYFYPVFIKTTDGGETWEDPIAVRLDGPDGLYGVLNYLTDEQIAEVFLPPLPARDEIPYTTAFDCDVVVDTWGNPHCAVTIGVGGSSEYSIVTGPYLFAAFDIFTTDGGTTWEAIMCGKMNQFRGTFGTDYSEDTRIQASSTQDGDKVFVAWLDTQLEGATENNAPDVFIRGIDVNMPPDPFYMTSSEGEDMPTNVTAFSEAMWQSYFFGLSRYTLSDNGTYTVPITYQQMTTPFDPALPVQFKYIQDFMFTDADFEIASVKDNNKPSNITAVSQNYPNPFSQTSNIQVSLENKSSLKLVVTNILGQRVLEINRGEVPAGAHQFVIDGSQLGNGVYFYTVYAGQDSMTRKMIVE